MASIPIPYRIIPIWNFINFTFIVWILFSMPVFWGSTRITIGFTYSLLEHLQPPFSNISKLLPQTCFKDFWTIWSDIKQQWPFFSGTSFLYESLFLLLWTNTRHSQIAKSKLFTFLMVSVHDKLTLSQKYCDGRSQYSSAFLFISC